MKFEVHKMFEKDGDGNYTGVVIFYAGLTISSVEKLYRPDQILSHGIEGLIKKKVKHDVTREFERLSIEHFLEMEKTRSEFAGIRIAVHPNVPQGKPLMIVHPEDYYELMAKCEVYIHCIREEIESLEIKPIKGVKGTATVKEISLRRKLATEPEPKIRTKLVKAKKRGDKGE